MDNGGKEDREQDAGRTAHRLAELLAHGAQQLCVIGKRQPIEGLDQGACGDGIARLSEEEDDLGRGAAVELDRGLQRRARIEAGADLAGQPRAPERGRLLEAAAGPDEFAAVTGAGARGARRQPADRWRDYRRH